MNGIGRRYLHMSEEIGSMFQCEIIDKKYWINAKKELERMSRRISTSSSTSSNQPRKIFG